MKYFDLFAGIGGFSKAITNAKADWECVGYSEINKFAILIYEKHFNHENYGDVRKINPDELPDFDLLTGGFPCQAFSVAGKKEGFNDPRGNLFFEIVRICKAKKPRYLLLENVKGLLSHESGRTFQTIIRLLTEIGYVLEWQILNSKDFGVPQNRERVFIIGYLRNASRPKVFPITRQSEQTLKNGQVVGTLQAGYGKGDRTGGYIIKTPKYQSKQAERIRDINGIATCLNASGGGLGAKTGLYAIPVSCANNPYRPHNGGKFRKNGSDMFTLTKNDIHGIYDGIRIRKLTPLECERLQGFPEGWTEGLSDTQRYYCLGNAITVNVVEAIISNF